MQPLEVAVKLDETFDLSACTNQRFLNWGKRNPEKKKNQQKNSGYSATTRATFRQLVNMIVSLCFCFGLKFRVYIKSLEMTK